MTMWSKWTKANCHLTSVNSTSIACWNVCSAFSNPSGMQVSRRTPRWDAKAILSQSFMAILTCQRLQLASNVDNIFASPIELINSSILGLWYVSWIVTALNLRELMQNRRVASCLRTKTIPDAPCVWAGSDIVHGEYQIYFLLLQFSRLRPLAVPGWADWLLICLLEFNSVLHRCNRT